jgi:hypothetical protein
MPPNKEQRERLKDWLKPGKKFRNHGPDSVERVLDPQAVLKSYAVGAVEAHYHVRIRPNLSTKDTHDFCVRLKTRQVGSDETSCQFDALHYEVSCVEDGHVEIAYVLGEDRFDFSVFVPTYESIEQGQRMQLAPFEPVVRLEVLDDCPMAGFDAGQSAVDLPFGIVDVSTDDELRDVPSFEFGSRTPADQIVSKVVESGAEVSEDITDDEAPFDGRAVNVIDDEGEAIRVTVEFLPPSIQLFAVGVSHPCCDVMLEGVHVFLRPVELVPTAIVEGAHDV